MWNSLTLPILAGGFCHAVLDWVFPRTCLRCGCLLNGGAGTFICEACRRQYVLIHEPVCDGCGVPFFGEVRTKHRCTDCLDRPPFFERSRSLFMYRLTGARVVHALKYEQGTYLQSELTELLWRDARWREYFREGILIPVPLHPRKMRSRGYNQAEVVARSVHDAFPSTQLADCLQRIRATPSQTFLSRKARLKNMKGAFHCRRPPPQGGRIILVDDVLTTGATLNAAASALRQAGVRGISAFTLAHG